MEYRRLGRLGHQSSVIIYGAAALADVDQEVADRSVQQALDAGVNHLDVAAGYGDAELRLGPWIPQIRDRVFLATKTQLRDREPAWQQINDSLERLQTDRVDLLQLHAVGDLDELDRCTAADGSLQAALRARDEGMVAAIGITGHGPQAPATHLEALRRFDFATVLTPLNHRLAGDLAYRSDYEALVEEVRRQDVGLMIIKAIARRNWPGVAAGQDRGEQRYATWYEPLDEADKIRAAVSWVLARNEITGLASAGDVRLLADTLAAEADRMPVQDAEVLLQGLDDYSSPFERMPA
ncbi:aldo/keto reductase [Angustibacter sp. McL0619]|uniref:aldo/keto reductase n=1 Tax=Angustibacter sp. McL0619 TaxID=3415676 RepID=UPI003CF4307D